MLNIFSLQYNIKSTFFYGGIENIDNLSYYCPIPKIDWSFENVSLKEYCDEASRLVYYRTLDHKYKDGHKNYFILSFRFEYADNRGIINKHLIDSVEFSFKEQFSKSIYKEIVRSIIESYSYKNNFHGINGNILFSNYNIFEVFPYKMDIIEEVSSNSVNISNTLQEGVNIGIENFNREKVIEIYNHILNNLLTDHNLIFHEIDGIINNVRKYLFYLNSPYSPTKERFLIINFEKVYYHQNFNNILSKYKKLKLSELTQGDVKLLREYFALKIFEKYEFAEIDNLHDQRSLLINLYKQLNENINSFLDSFSNWP